MIFTRLAFTITTAGLLLPAMAQDIYRYHKKGIPTYSDVPQALKPSRSQVINIRTGSNTSTPTSKPLPTPETLADKQAELSREVVEENRRITNKNQEIESENIEQQKANCKTAQLNRQLAESARSNNRAALIEKYDNDINRFCQ